MVMFAYAPLKKSYRALVAFLINVDYLIHKMSNINKHLEL